MKEITYNTAFATLCEGFKQLLYCLLITGAECLYDLGVFVKKHYLFTIVSISMIIILMIQLGRARVERDHLAKQSYAQEVTIDSLMILHQ